MVTRLMAFLLVLAMWPALGESVELVVHLAEHGDLAHDPDGDHPDGPLGTDEHGCSGTFHLCATGHVSVISAPAVATVVHAEPPAALVIAPAPIAADGCDAPAPPIRPPIA